MKGKKILALLLAVAMLLVAVSCGSSDKKEESVDAKDNSTVETEKKDADKKDVSESTGKAKITTKDGEFPNGPITIVVGFSAGGPTDLGARYMATSLEKSLGVPVMVENIPGSGGWLAWNQLLNNTKKDGYTIGVVNHNFAMGAYDEDTPRKETLDDMDLLINQVTDPSVLAIRADETRFTDLKTFIEYAKENEILVTAQTINITDGDATCVEWFNQTFGTKMTIVPTDSSSDGRTMFIAGDVDVYFANISDSFNDYHDGTMKLVCQFTEERNDWIPDVPTMKELDKDNYFIGYSNRGYFYPKGVDPAIVEFMQEAMLEAMEDPTHIENLEKQGLTPDPLAGEDFYNLLNSQLETRKKVWKIK